MQHLLALMIYTITQSHYNKYYILFNVKLAGFSLSLEASLWFNAALFIELPPEQLARSLANGNIYSADNKGSFLTLLLLLLVLMSHFSYYLQKHLNCTILINGFNRSYPWRPYNKHSIYLAIINNSHHGHH